MQTLLQDLKYSFRQLRQSPGFTATAVVSQMLGIGATTAVFSIVWAVLMNPYPYAAPDRMAHMRLTTKSGAERGFGLTFGQWQILRKSQVVEDAFATEGWSLTVTGRDLPEDVNADYITSNTDSTSSAFLRRWGGRWCLRMRSMGRTRSRWWYLDISSGSDTTTAMLW